MKKLEELIEEVRDAESFLAFAKALIRDRETEVKKERIKPSSPHGPGHQGWENGTIEAFLEAAVAWAEDSKALAGNNSNGGEWKKFALFLWAGKGYE